MAPVSLEAMSEVQPEKRPAESTTTTTTTAEDVAAPALKKQDTTKSKKQPKIKRRKYKAKKDLEPTSPLGVLNLEIQELIKELSLTEEDVTNPINELLNNELDANLYHRVVSHVEILKFTSNGDGLAIIDSPIAAKKQIVIVPFGTPGDIVKLKVFKTHPLYVESDLLEIEQNSAIRDDSLIKCKYFGACSGCQYQMLEYDEQLKLKRDVIINAYKFFAPTLTKTGVLPLVSSTESSPLQYDYRTKLTPHFDMPRRKPEIFTRPNLGFGSKGRPEWRDIPTAGQILDIEECIIGTKVINKGMEFERGKFMQNFNEYKKGATILLRENTELATNGGEKIEGELDPTTNETFVIREDPYIKTYVTKPRQIVKEIIDGYQFEFSAGEFFQNNNSILPKIISYVSENLQLDNSQDENYLIDAYCGSGLFSITSAKSVTKSIGVEISADSVKFAQRNAHLNKIENCEFIVGKAEKIFADISIPNHKTSIILDPPRKGCDEVFLRQLSDFKPVKIIYISCNVHSQARDLEYFLSNTANGISYQIEKIKGFDFFPQTHHVESVAVLSLK